MAKDTKRFKGSVTWHTQESGATRTLRDVVHSTSIKAIATLKNGAINFEVKLEDIQPNYTRAIPGYTTLPPDKELRYIIKEMVKNIVQSETPRFAEKIEVDI